MSKILVILLVTLLLSSFEVLNLYTREKPVEAANMNSHHSREKKTSVNDPATTSTKIRLRSGFTTLSKNDVGSMLKKYGFFSKQYSSNAEFCNPEGDFKNQYESKTINGDQVVIDHAAGLIWHQSGSSDFMGYEKAEQWLRDFNNRGYAGYNDWRLPTLEEGASLLENRKLNGDLHIDPVFSDRQRFIWTGDKGGDLGAWVVIFDIGIVYSVFPRDGSFVRPVHPVQ